MNSHTAKYIGRIGLLLAMLGEFSEVQQALSGHYGEAAQLMTWAFIFSGAVLFVVIGL